MHRLYIILPLLILIVISSILIFTFISPIFLKQEVGNIKWVVVIETVDGQKLTYDQEKLPQKYIAVYLPDGTEIERVYWYLYIKAIWKGEVSEVKVEWYPKAGIWYLPPGSWSVEEGILIDNVYDYVSLIPDHTIYNNTWSIVEVFEFQAEDIESLAKDMDIPKEDEFTVFLYLKDNSIWDNDNIKVTFKAPDGSVLETATVNFDDIARVDVYWSDEAGKFELIGVQVQWSEPKYQFFGMQLSPTELASVFTLIFGAIILMLIMFFICTKVVCRVV